jgi:trans-2,3-dihydro-3-hydroxyanthranilate isomerase
MEKKKIYILDVFAEEKYAGNQLAVIRDAKSLSDIEMQKIAKEMNYSETTFILSDKKKDGGYDVRIFTPEKEVPFAGHPTLGTAYVIQHEIENRPVKNLILNLAVGKIPVTIIYNKKIIDTLWMKQIQPIFGWVLDSETISQVLDLDVQEIDIKSPIQEVSTGLPFIIVPLKTLESLKRVRININKYFNLLDHTQAKALLVFCPETHKKGNDLTVRVFADYYGVAEDPATGSANGCLAGYLVKYRYFGSEKINIRVEQGYEIGRPSLLFLNAEEKSSKIDVFVGGKVIMVAKGELV